MALIVKIDGSINGELMRWIGETEHEQMDLEKLVHYKTIAFVWVKVQQNMKTWKYSSHGCKFEEMERYGGTDFVNHVTVKFTIRQTDDAVVEGEEPAYYRMIEIESPWGSLKRDFRENELMIFTFNQIRKELENAEHECTIKYNIIRKRENEGWE